MDYGLFVVLMLIARIPSLGFVLFILKKFIGYEMEVLF